MLFQVQSDGSSLPIAYASRGLTPAYSNKSSFGDIKSKWLTCSLVDQSIMVKGSRKWVWCIVLEKDNVAVDSLSCNHLQVVPVEGLARHRLLLSCHCQDLLFIKCFRKIQLLKDLSMIP